MQWLAHSLLGVYLFILCISGGMYFLGTEFQNAGILNANNNGLLERSLDMQFYRNQYNQTTANLSGGNYGGFNPLFVYGDPLVGASQFFGIISGGILVQMEEKMAFPQSFLTVTQVAVLGMPGVSALMYYLSNRA
ncbi:MAG: hypothetical protein ABI361_03345 [Nitrososphaera sp.]